jgi:peptidoglycan/xylan/chitin deacetylase (PgdA/CDA1 family)
MSDMTPKATLARAARLVSERSTARSDHETAHVALQAWLEAEAEITQLKEALRKFGGHDLGCHWWEIARPADPDDCDCGLYAAIVGQGASDD